MLVTLNTSNSELSTLKGDIIVPVSNNTKEDEKTKEPDEKNRIKRQRDGVTSKEEWKKNT
jgi:hypothetical protein